METEYLIRHLMLLSVMGISAYTDLKSSKVPNMVMALAYLAALLIRAFMAPAIELGPLIFQLLLILAFLIFYLRGMLGGGDLKLFTLITFTFPDYTGSKILVSAILLAFAAICLIPAYLAVKKAFSGHSIRITAGHSYYSYPYSFMRSKLHKIRLPMAVFAFAGEAAVFITEVI